MKSVILSLFLSIIVLLTINFIFYKLIPLKISIIHQKLRWKDGDNTSESSVKIKFGMVTISSKLLSAETLENGKLKTSTEAINTFNCSNNMELYNRYAYQWKIIDKNFCSQKYPNLLLLIFAITAVEQREHRILIRKTWGNIRLYEDFKTVVLFPLGITDDLDMMNLIQKEQQKYGDIIQQEFFDTYKNLTIKTLMCLQFINDFCSNVKYILKIDSDITFNYFKLVEILENRTAEINTNHSFTSKSFFCYVRNYGQVNRYDTKWPVSYKEYPMQYYPRHCSGSFYLLTGYLARLLFEQARFCKLFWIEDVHVTGHLGLRVHAYYEEWNEKILFKWNQLEEVIKTSNVLFVLIYSPNEHIQLWKWLKNYYGYDKEIENF